MMEMKEMKEMWKTLYEAATDRGFTLHRQSGLAKPDITVKMIAGAEAYLGELGMDNDKDTILGILDDSIPNLVNSWTGAETEGRRAVDRWLRKGGKKISPVPPTPVPPVPPVPTPTLGFEVPDPVDPEYIKPEEWDLFGRTVMMGIMDGKPDPICLYGEAGTGKTEMAIQMAKAINARVDPEFSSGISGITAPIMASDVKGFVNAVGETVPTGFTQGYTKKGFTVIEEMDRSEPPALICINMALANHQMDIPGAGMIKQHPMCIVVATANTPGIGATEEYNTANQLDRSTRDRFIFIEVKFDKKLATKLAKGDKSLVDFVMKWNEACELIGLGQNTSSYRAITRIVKVIEKAGYTVKEALETIILKGAMGKDNLRSVLDKMGSMSANPWYTAMDEIQKAMRDVY